MVYARRQTRPKPRKAETKRWPAPVAGWVSNRALSDPRSIDGPGAAVLDNFIPRATGVALRRGKLRYATLTDQSLPVTSLFSYRNGTQEHLFGANAHAIYDLSEIEFAQDALIGDGTFLLATENGDVFGWNSTDGRVVADGFTSGDWSVIQFATTGGIYLVGVNGVDTGFLYDGDVLYPLIKGGVARLDYDASSAAFSAGDTLTGDTSGATATIWRAYDAGNGTGYVLLTGTTGTFTDNETLTGSTGGSALANGSAQIAAPGVDFGSLSSANMAFVWSYKNRIWFAERESLNAWYLPVDSIGGEAKVFPMGGVFANGGELLFGARWSLESGGQGGLSEQNVFVSSNGEVAIYQGSSPEELATWSLVGVYRIGAPLGRRAYLRGGGDLAIATTVGLVPLSKAISLDVTALNVATVSYKIADAWTEAIEMRGTAGWQAMIWPEAKLAVVAPPDLLGSSGPVMFVSNTETGAWARFTNWHALCMEVYQGDLFFGSTDGRVFRANAGGLDDGEVYSGAVVPLFDDMGIGASVKIGKMARARVRANGVVNDDVTLLSDFSTVLPAAPDAAVLTGSNTWDSGVWGQSAWGAPTPNVINQEWRSAGAIGYSIAPCFQVTSGSVAALDVELIDFETLHTTAEAVT